MTDFRLRLTRVSVATLCSGALLASGCTQTRRPQPRTEQSPAATAPSDPSAEVANRVHDLSRQAEDYEVLSRQLPGRSTTEHRDLMVKVFTQLGQILPLLHGPQQSSMFRQQLMILDTSRAQLVSAPDDLSVDPTIDTGLRTTFNALTDISHSPSLDAGTLSGSLDQFRKKLDELDATRGLTHQVVAAEAVELSAGVITKMADMLTASLATDTTQPGAEPVATPTTGEAATTGEASPTTVPSSIEPTSAPAAAPDATPAPGAATEPAGATEPAPAGSAATEPAPAAAATEPAAPTPTPAPAEENK